MSEEVLATEGLKHLSQEQAEEVVEFIKTFSGISYMLFEKELEEGRYNEVMRELAK